MSVRECRWSDCQVPVAGNGYFCPGHWRQLSLETRHLILAYPVRPGPPPAGRNQALHRALIELRLKANPGAYSGRPRIEVFQDSSASIELLPRGIEVEVDHDRAAD